MKNISSIKYIEIKKLLNLNNLNCYSDLKETEIFLSINSIQKAGTEDLTFAIPNTSKDLLNSVKAKACLINDINTQYLSSKTIPIIVEDPYKAFALVSNLFLVENISNGKISKLSSIDPKLKINKNVQIDPFVQIRENCQIDENVIIETGCIIGPNVKIDKNTIIKSNVSLINCSIGENCIIKSGAVIGGAGFGFDPKSKSRIQHFGDVIIEQNCNIGSNTTIDRAVFDSTIISQNSFIDNLVQIAHNVVIGPDSIIAAQVGIAGSTKIGKNVMIGGQAGISGHLNIGNNVTIAAKSGVTKNLDDNSVVAGFPAIDIKKWKKLNIKFNKLL